MGKENYFRNQCSLIIRIDGEELEVPVNFGLTADEIRAIYPYCAKLANTKIPNPAMKFEADSKDGRFAEMSEEEYAAEVERISKQSEFWYQKPNASLLELAIRMALDIQFKGIQSIQDAFATVTPFENIKVKETVSTEEATKILKEAGMETDTDHEFDPGDEHDVEKGSAGNMSVDIYGSGEDFNFLSKELDAIDTAQAEDRFEKIIQDKKVADIPDKYKSKYKAKGFEEGQIGEDGLLDMYANSGSTDAIFGDEPDDGSTAEELLSDKKQDDADTASVESDVAEDEELLADDDFEVATDDLEDEEHIEDPEFEDIYEDVDDDSEE